MNLDTMILSIQSAPIVEADGPTRPQTWMAICNRMAPNKPASFVSVNHEAKKRFTYLTRRKSAVAAILLYGLLASRLVAQQATNSTTPATTPSPVRAAEAASGSGGSETLPAPTIKPSPVAVQKSTTPLTTEQIRSNLPADLADKVEFLRRQRKVTLEAIDETTAQLKTLTSSKASAQDRRLALEAPAIETMPASKERIEFELQRAKTELAESQQKLEAARKNPTPNLDVAKLEFTLREKQNSLIEIQDAVARQEQRKIDDEKRIHDVEAAKKKEDSLLSQFNEEIDKATQTQLSYQRTLREIDELVNQMFIASDATNSFKLKMSIILSLLVAVVIGGFFWVAWSDEQVKRSIFSSESGIQFITLFAIVISVILFGIIGVLEGKELSALLGGLSGYILGRGNQSATRPSSSPT